MFGRVRRAATSTGDDLRAYAVLHTYRPEAIAAAMAVGLGSAGGLGGGGSTTGRAVNGVIGWGRREQVRYVRLPGAVLVVVTANAVVLHEWTPAGGRGRELVRWPYRGFTAEPVRYSGQLGVRLVADGKIVILTGSRGPWHRALRRTVRTVVAAGRAAGRS